MSLTETDRLVRRSHHARESTNGHAISRECFDLVIPFHCVVLDHRIITETLKIWNPRHHFVLEDFDEEDCHTSNGPSNTVLSTEEPRYDSPTNDRDCSFHPVPNEAVIRCHRDEARNDRGRDTTDCAGQELRHTLHDIEGTPQEPKNSRIVSSVPSTRPIRSCDNHRSVDSDTRTTTQRPPRPSPPATTCFIDPHRVLPTPMETPHALDTPCDSDARTTFPSTPTLRGCNWSRDSSCYTPTSFHRRTRNTSGY